MDLPEVGPVPLSLLVTIGAGVGGLLLQDLESAALVALVGFFLVKSAQSVKWMLRPETTA